MLKTMTAVGAIFMSVGFALPAFAEGVIDDVELVKDMVNREGSQVVCLSTVKAPLVGDFGKYISTLEFELNRYSPFKEKCGGYKFKLFNTQVLQDGFCLYLDAEWIKGTGKQPVGVNYFCCV